MKFLVTLCVAVLLVGFNGCKKKQEEESGLLIPENVSVKKTARVSALKMDDMITMIASQPWHSNIDRAFSLAKNENKNVIVMVGEDSCKWCNKITEETFTDSRIAKKFHDYILVYIKRSDKDSLKYTPEFDGKIPSIFFMDANKQMIESIIGYFLADDFVEYMKEIEQ